MKKSHVLIVLVILITTFSLVACSGKQEYAKVEISSVKDNTVLKTIEDTKILKEIGKTIVMGESDLYTETRSIPDGENPEYCFVFYTKQESESSNFTLTIYQDSDFIYDEFTADDTSIPSDYVIYRSSKVVQYLRSLI